LQWTIVEDAGVVDQAGEEAAHHCLPRFEWSAAPGTPAFAYSTSAET